MSRELMKMALEELQNARDHIYLLPENEQPLTEEQILNRINAAITVLHQKVYGTAPTTQPEQEPVAFINVEKQKLEWAKLTSWHTPTIVNLPKIPLYTAPPKREWVGLTDEERRQILLDDPIDWIVTIETKLREKNHG